MSHPKFAQKRVKVCENCFRTTLLAREGVHTETVPGPVANQAMLRLANSLMGMFLELTPGQPVKVKREGFIMKVLPTAKPSIVDGIQSEDFQVTAADGAQISVRWYHPAPLDPTKTYPATFYMHGGGWTVGSVFQKDQDTNYRLFAKKLQTMFFAIEFRLSPEHPYVSEVSSQTSSPWPKL